MKNSYGNIYKIARKYTDYTQEEAKELLNVSLKSLQNYETFKTTPGDEIVNKMIEVYQTPWLAYLHLKHSNEVGKKYLPDLNLTDLAKSVLRLQKEVSDLNKINPDMIDIACDGLIEQHEEERWSNVTKEVNEVISASLAVIFSKNFNIERMHYGI